MESTAARARELPDLFRTALRGIASTVTIVTAADAERHHGMTATAVMSLSLEPPSMVVCINRQTLLHDILTVGRRFCVNILGESQAPVSAAFSGTLPPTERFNQGNWSYDGSGLGYLEDAQANIFCRKAAAFPYGTHSMFVGEVEDVRFGTQLSPLLYHNAAYCTSLPHAVCG